MSHQISQESKDRASVYLQVIGIGSDGADKTLSLVMQRHGVYSDDIHTMKRYLINVGEGTQRLCGELNMKLGSVDTILNTHVSTERLGGLPGVIMALSSSGQAKLNIYGCDGLKKYIDSCSNFVQRQYPEISAHEVINEEEIFHDDFIRFQASKIRLRRKSAISSSLKCSFCKDDGLNELPGDISVLLENLYNQMDKQKINHIPKIIQTFKGRLQALVNQLKLKYGQVAEDYIMKPKKIGKVTNSLSASSSSDTTSEEDGSDDVSTDDESQNTKACQNSQSLEENLVKWLHDFYTKHSPSHLPQIQAIAMRYQGQEEHLKSLLHKKYLISSSAASPLHGIKNNKRKASEEIINKKKKILSIGDHQADSTISQIVYVNPYVSSTSSMKVNEEEEILIYKLKALEDDSTITWIVDCPSIHWVESVVNHPSLSLSLCMDHQPSLIVHLASCEIVAHPSYSNWMQSIPKNVNHLILDPNVLLSSKSTISNAICFASSFKQIMSFHTHASFLFPVSSAMHQLANNCIQEEKVKKKRKVRVLFKAADNRDCLIAVPGLKYILRKQKRMICGADYSSTLTPSLHPNTSFQNMPLQNCLFEPELTFLGTGSAAPSKLRNATSIYLRFPNSECGMLMDVGEGAYGQMWRRFGDDTEKIIGNLQVIWISHRHADHHCGTLRILMEYFKYNQNYCHKKALKLIAPLAVLQYVQSSLDLIPHIFPIDTKTCFDFMSMNHEEKMEFIQSPYIIEMSNVQVFHCHDSYGLILRLLGGLKLVYSGDTRPCDALIKSGYMADILIHEATFENDMKQDAILKKHSTVEEAIKVAERMNVRHLLLTHFSQRYPTLPPMDAITTFNSTIIPCFDLMSLQLTFEALSCAGKMIPLIYKTIK